MHFMTKKDTAKLIEHLKHYDDIYEDYAWAVEGTTIHFVGVLNGCLEVGMKCPINQLGALQDYADVSRELKKTGDKE